jgi:hypothetical protein
VAHASFRYVFVYILVLTIVPALLLVPLDPRLAHEQAMAYVSPSRLTVNSDANVNDDGALFRTHSYLLFALGVNASTVVSIRVARAIRIEWCS